MSKAIFIALSGAVLKEKQMELISQNLANSNSSSYKKMRVTFKDYLTSPESEQEGRIMGDLASVSTDFSTEASIRQEIHWISPWRATVFLPWRITVLLGEGDFKINSEGHLTTQTGIPVLGLNGVPIYLPPGKLEIGPGGEVTVNQAQTRYP